MRRLMSVAAVSLAALALAATPVMAKEHKEKDHKHPTTAPTTQATDAKQHKHVHQDNGKGHGEKQNSEAHH